MIITLVIWLNICFTFSENAQHSDLIEQNGLHIRIQQEKSYNEHILKSMP